MGNQSESLGIVISSHFTDEAINLRAVYLDQVDFLLRLDLLFFDYLAVPVVGLLDNPYFTSMISQRPEIASKLLRGSDRFISPIVFSYSDDSSLDSFRDITERVLSAGTKMYVSEEAFRRNAEFMDEDRPLTYSASDSLFRSKYHDDLLRAVSFIQQEGLRAWQSQEVIIPPRLLGGLHHWLEKIDPNKCNCTQAFKAIESDLQDGDERREAKVLAAATWMYSLRGSMVGSLSVPSQYLPSVSLFRRLSTITHLDAADAAEYRELSISVPFSGIVKLPIRFIFELRKQDAFRELRTLLSSYRKSAESVSIDKLKGKINQCREQLLSFERKGRDLLAEGEQGLLDDLLRQLRKGAEIDRLRVWHTKGEGLTAGLAIAGIRFAHLVPLVAFACGGSYLLGRYIQKHEAAMNTSLAPEAKNDTMYSVAWGTHSGSSD